jgi:gluconolactonase
MSARPAFLRAERLQAELAELEERKRVPVSFDVRDPELHRLFPEDVRVERVATGLLNAEGPVWRGDHLLLTDSPRNRILRWQEGPEGFSLTTFRYPSGQPLDRPITQGQPGANGLTLDRQGRLLACEHGNRRVTRTEHDGTISVVADRYQGKRLNRPNDVVVRSDGTIYFTDPPLRLPTPTEPRELEVAGVFRVTPDGHVRLVADDFLFPNGLSFSPDESVLYVDDSRQRHVRAFDVAADGSVSHGRVFADLQSPDIGVPDGMKLDQQGRLYVGGPGGIWVFRPDGHLLGRLLLPEWPRNLAWGGPDWRTLYITAATSLYRLRAGVAGMPVG